MGPRFIISPEVLEKPGVKPTTPGLQGKWLNHYTMEDFVALFSTLARQGLSIMNYYLQPLPENYYFLLLKPYVKTCTFQITRQSKNFFYQALRA